MKFNLLICLCALLLVKAVQGQTTAFTYQGRLTEAGAPANGNYDLRFALYNASSGGNLVAAPLTNSAVTVGNGLFLVTLDFGGAAFHGSGRWLEVGVRGAGSLGAFNILAPRQAFTATPYAIEAVNALTASNLSGTLPDARLSTNVALLNTSVVFTGSVTATQFNGSGVGLANVPAASLNGTLPDARLSSNVALLNGPANFLGNVSAPQFAGNGTGLTNVPGRIFDTIPTASAIQAVPNTGYLATNDTAAVVVTLPATLRVGETVRVSASGAAGWIVAQNTNQSILVGNLLDSIGLTWTPRDVVRSWRAVASSLDGKKLVAAVNGGQIYTSTNSGATWTARDFNRSWVATASSGDGTKLFAAVSSGRLYISTDSGVSWTPRDANRSWTSVASSFDGANLVATVNSGQVFTSTDSGGSWTPRENTRFWVAVASSANGQRLVAAVQGGQLYTSTNAGALWIPRESNRAWSAVASSADGSLLIAAVNNGQLYASRDAGTNWVVTGPSMAASWSSVACSADGARIAAVVNGGGIYISTDSGATWTTRAGLPSANWLGVACSGDASTLVAAPSANQLYVSSQATTTSPGTAGFLSGTRLSSVELQHIGGGVFMPIGFVGTIRAH
ncbi:MAG: hypothetical protein IH623_12190 [Verrucomicrobia bacterium]|nr:hypothetical protein [Verrucomicrobiota bacterium]